MTKNTSGEKVDTNLYRSIIGSLLYLTASRSDIAFAVGVCARYQADSRTSHLHCAKRILKYISAEAEYIAAESSCSQLLWMKQMLDEYGITQSSMILYCDNLSAISISKNPLTDIFTKPLDVATFEGLRASVGILQRPAYINASYSEWLKLDSRSIHLVSPPPKTLQLLAVQKQWIPQLRSRQLPRKGNGRKEFRLSIRIRRYASPFRRMGTVRFPILNTAPMQSDRQILRRQLQLRKKFLSSPHPECSSFCIFASGGVSPKVAPPRPSEHTKYSGTKEKTELEATSTSTENQSASPEKDPSDHRSNEEPGESSISRSTEGPSEFSTPVSTPAHMASSFGFRRPPTKGQQVVSTKAGRRKVPPNVSSLPIDGVSFHSKEGAHKWKYVVKQRITDEANIADQYNFCPAILGLIRNAGLIRTVFEVGPFYPRLMRELIMNLPSDFNDPSADEYQKVHIRGVCFNVSRELLNSYLDITLPADYEASYPTPERLAEELTGGTVPVWPVDGQLPVASLTQSTILTTLDTVGSAPRVIPLNMRLFQGAHFPDVAAEFDNAQGGTSTPAASQPTVGHPVTLYVTYQSAAASSYF
ncbi:flocculation protein FLO11-like [Cucumis melo var. makuwa]|uniref:Flocculation protein FLO11-like n=1 Tax=Cucumis melo var. makuwa TaxID=1194695 RepID=A0A5A7UVX2_CUCMM|nr:flocculation protein FLO11-like [Cucumis melo var. makuwa]